MAEYGNLIHLLWQSKVNSRKCPGFLEYWNSVFVSWGEGWEQWGSEAETAADKMDSLLGILLSREKAVEKRS